MKFKLVIAVSFPYQFIPLENKELFTISVRKAISFSRLDKCEKCLSFSNSWKRWCLITGAGGKSQPRAASTTKHSNYTLRGQLTSEDIQTEQLWEDRIHFYSC